MLRNKEERKGGGTDVGMWFTIKGTSCCVNRVGIGRMGAKSGRKMGGHDGPDK